jgi:hypothetical protein
MTNVFSRMVPRMERTFALRALNQHETEINRHYWSFKVISDYAGYLARQKVSSDKTFRTATLFHATGPDAVRIPPTASDWLDARDDLENWLRVSSLVSATSYLETYLRQVVKSALMSAPMARYGIASAVDGTHLLKIGKEIPYDEDIRRVTVGDWSSRAEGFRSLFGTIPSAIAENLKRLEAIRRLRNMYAHGFGRDSEIIPDPSAMAPGTMARLQAGRFLNDIGIISKVAASVDELLLRQFIGNFELVHFYHLWRAQPRTGKEGTYSEARALARSLNKEANCTVNAPFCAGLISFYNAA